MENAKKDKKISKQLMIGLLVIFCGIGVELLLAFIAKLLR
jgi:hypothetical protein